MQIEGDGKTGKKKQRWEVLYELNEKMKKQKENCPEFLENKEDPECTFKPNIKTNPPLSMGKFSNDKDFFERNQVWVEQKKKRVEDLKRTGKSRDFDNCTFQPALVNPATLSKSVHNEQGVLTKGIDKFLKRQQQARHLKEEKEALISNMGAGHGWKNQITVPQSPKIGQKTTVASVQALRKVTSKIQYYQILTKTLLAY